MRGGKLLGSFPFVFLILVVFEVFKSVEFDDMHPRGTCYTNRCGHKPTGHYFGVVRRTGKSLKTRKGQICLSLKQEGEKHRMTPVIKDCQLIDRWKK